MKNHRVDERSNPGLYVTYSGTQSLYPQRGGKSSRPTKEPESQEPFFKFTQSVAQKLLQTDLTAAEWRLWAYLTQLDPFGDRGSPFNPHQAMQACNIGRSAFFQAKAKFQRYGLFNFRDSATFAVNLCGCAIFSLPTDEKSVESVPNDSFNRDPLDNPKSGSNLDLESPYKFCTNPSTSVIDGNNSETLAVQALSESADFLSEFADCKSEKMDGPSETTDSDIYIARACDQTFLEKAKNTDLPSEPGVGVNFKLSKESLLDENPSHPVEKNPNPESASNLSNNQSLHSSAAPASLNDNVIIKLYNMVADLYKERFSEKPARPESETEGKGKKSESKKECSEFETFKRELGTENFEKLVEFKALDAPESIKSPRAWAYNVLKADLDRARQTWKDCDRNEAIKRGDICSHPNQRPNFENWTNEQHFQLAEEYRQKNKEFLKERKWHVEWVKYFIDRWPDYFTKS